MELLNGIKSMLASLTGKTSSNVISTDGVMLIDASDGTPSGRITAAALARNMNEQLITVLNAQTDIDTLVDAGLYQSSAWLNAPHAPATTGILIIPFAKSGFWRFRFFVSTGNDFWMQTGTSGSWSGTWRKIAVDLPAFYNSYANLAALATGIMGQTISSITAAYFQGTIAQAVFDNVFIAVTRLSDTIPLAVKPKDWSTYSSASAYHVDGVLLVSGDKKLVIAPADTSLGWGADSDTHAASGNTTTNDRDVAMAKFDGKTCTDTAVQVSEYSAATTACGYCHAYTTVTSAYDTTKTAYARRKAGMWWLPSLGEMMVIWSNMIKINQVMSLIGGTAIVEAAHWTSTEHSQAIAWFLICSSGNIDGNYKKGVYHVRPICAF